MRSNKVENTDLFTAKANENYRKHVKTKSKKALELIKTNINWEALLYPIEKEISRVRPKSTAGRKPMSLLVIVRCFLLQYIYDLSDPRLEEEIADRRSFQIFLEINSGDSIPDDTTICRYREMFSKLGLDKLLFESFNDHLRRRNMMLERVTLVDATIKEAQAKPESKRDKDAAHTKKRNKSYYGYKGHIGMDMATGTIHSADFTPANVHDSQKFDEMTHGKEKSVYADKGYAKKARREKLEKNGTFCGIMFKAYKNRPLTKEQIAKNKQLSKIRNAVERPFSYMKRVLNYARCRYYDLERNRFQFMMSAIVYNMRCMLTLSGA
jgi:IS5 family transposase